VRSGPGEARTILLLHIISARPSKQPLMVRTFLQVYTIMMELGSCFFVSARTNKDIIIIALRSNMQRCVDVLWMRQAQKLFCLGWLLLPKRSSTVQHSNASMQPEYYVYECSGRNNCVLNTLFNGGGLTSLFEDSTPGWLCRSRLGFFEDSRNAEVEDQAPAASLVPDAIQSCALVAPEWPVHVAVWSP